MRLWTYIIVAATLPWGPAMADDAQTPAQAASQEMMVLYEDICLARFPNSDAVGSDLAARKAQPLAGQETRAALLGHDGAAWAVTGDKGRYVVALEATPAQHCVVTGPAAEDEGVRAVFSMLVGSFAKGHEMGALQLPPVRDGKLGGQPATMQVIGATQDGRARQAFVNVGVAAADGTMRLRLTRELAPR